MLLSEMSESFGARAAIAVLAVAVIGAAVQIWKRSTFARIPMTFDLNVFLHYDCCSLSSLQAVSQRKAKNDHTASLLEGRGERGAPSSAVGLEEGKERAV
jgi:hypothetical protein